MTSTIYNGSKIKYEKFDLIYSETKDEINFKYINKTDTTKTIEIKTLKNSYTDTLFVGVDKFIKKHRKLFMSEKLHGFKFGFYEPEKSGDDATGPILFHPEYGLLGLNNVYGPTLIMLHENDDVLSEDVVRAMNKL